MFNKEKYWENRKLGIRGQGLFTNIVRHLTWKQHQEEVRIKKQAKKLGI